MWYYMKTIIKLIIACLLFGCLFKMPYGYYQFVRLSCTIGFAWLSYNEFKNKQIITGILCLILGVLFNPIIKVSFSRKLWNDIDVAIGIAFIIWVITDLVDSRKKANH